MAKRQAQTDRQPRVGIFWLYKDSLLMDSTPVANGEPYGDLVGHPTGHVDHWAALQRRGQVAPEVEYEEPPRGRVIYSPKDQQFTLMADQCILANAKVLKEILRNLHLPKNTILASDLHYRCARCGYGSARDDNDEF